MRQAGASKVVGAGEWVDTPALVKRSDLMLVPTMSMNLAARLEKIASQTRRTIVASEGFAGICRGGWSDLGEFPVAGFSKAARVYGLADETAAA